MKRFFASFGLLLLIAGTPAALVGSFGAPHVPRFNLAEAQQALTGGLLTVDSVLRPLALAAWALWAYLLLVVVLRMAALTVLRQTFRFSSLLVGFTDRAAPSFVVRLVDAAVGGIMLLSSFSFATALPAGTAGAAPAAPAVKAHVASTNAQADDHARSYVVRPGDSLWRISAKQLGSGYRWQEIYQLNRDRLFPDGRTMGDPRLIRPNWILWLPEDPTSSAPASPPSNPAPPTPEPTAAPMPIPSPAPFLNGNAPEAISPESRPDRDPSEKPDASTTPPPKKQPGRSVSNRPTVELPSGVALAASFGSGILASQALAVLRRRRRYRPSMAPVNETEDPTPEPEIVVDLKRARVPEDTSLLSRAVVRIVDAWEERTEVWPPIAWASEAEKTVTFLIESAVSEDHDWPEGITVEASGQQTLAVVKKDATPSAPHLLPLEQGMLVPLAEDDSNAAAFCGLLAAGPVSVKGARAADWAEQAVLAAISDHPRQELEVIVLVEGESFGALVDVPHVRVASWTDGEAIDEVESDIRGRAQFFPRNGSTDIWTYLSSPQPEFISATLIVATKPPPSLKSRMEGIAAQAGRLGCGFVAIDWKPRTSQAEISIDATVEMDSLPQIFAEPLRPFLLEDKEITQIVGILSEAHPITREDAELEPEGKDSNAAEDETAAEVLTSNGNGKIHHSPSQAKQWADYQLPLAKSLEEREASNGSSESLRPEVEVRCLGPVSVWRGGKEITRGWKLNSKELLVYLVAHPDGVSKDRIVEEFWPSVGSKQGDYMLRQAIYHLRKAVSGPDDTWSEKFVTRFGESVRLDQQLWEVDSWRFEELLAAAKTQSGEESISTLKQALSIYRGEFCDDGYFAWVELLRERFRRAYLSASVTLAEELEATGDSQDAIQTLDRAIELNPLCEDLYRQAIQLEISHGAISAARSRYQKLAATLEREIGEEPDSSTQELMRSVREGGNRHWNHERHPS